MAASDGPAGTAGEAEEAGEAGVGVGVLSPPPPPPHPAKSATHPRTDKEIYLFMLTNPCFLATTAKTTHACNAGTKFRCFVVAYFMRPMWA